MRKFLQGKDLCRGLALSGSRAVSAPYFSHISIVGSARDKSGNFLSVSATCIPFRKARRRDTEMSNRRLIAIATLCLGIGMAMAGTPGVWVQQTAPQPTDENG